MLTHALRQALRVAIAEVGAEHIPATFKVDARAALAGRDANPEQAHEFTEGHWVPFFFGQRAAAAVIAIARRRSGVRRFARAVPPAARTRFITVLMSFDSKGVSFMV
jgi:hypothetical protein